MDLSTNKLKKMYKLCRLIVQTAGSLLFVTDTGMYQSKTIYRSGIWFDFIQDFLEKRLIF